MDFSSPESSPSPGFGSSSWSPPSPEDLAPLLPGYEIETILGRGGMGAVYRGIQKSLGRRVAIKLLPASLGASEEFRDRFTREARSMAMLNHPNIVQIYDYGHTGEGHAYFVMEFVDGCDLHAFAHSGALDSEGALNAISQICDALQYAHSKGLIHRDIKPANVFLSSEGLVKVGDFGLAKIVAEEKNPADPGLTLTGMAMGTPNYVAPEQLIAGELVDQRADLYSLGVMFYELLTGRIPRGRVAPPSQVCNLKPGIDPRIDEIVFRSMEQNRESRFQSAADLRGAIDAVRSQPLIQISEQKKPVSGHRSRTAIFACLTAGTLAVAGVIFALSTERSVDHLLPQTTAPINTVTVIQPVKESVPAPDKPKPTPQPTLPKTEISAIQQTEPRSEKSEPKEVETAVSAREHQIKEATGKLEQIEAQFAAKIAEEVVRPHQEKTAKLLSQYLAALDREKVSAAKGNDLKTALIWEAEIKHLSSTKQSATPDPGGVTKLAEMRSIFLTSLGKLEAERDAAGLRLFSETERELDHCEKSLDPKLDPANLVSKRRSSFRKMLSDATVSAPATASNDMVQEKEPIVKQEVGKVESRLFLQGLCRGEPFVVPTELIPVRFDWIHTLEDGVWAGSPDEGVYVIDAKGVRKVHPTPAKYWYRGHNWDPVYLDYDNTLHWKGRDEIAGQLKQVKKVDLGGRNGKDYHFSLIALMESGEIEVVNGRINWQWDFEKWKVNKRFKDVAMSRGYGLEGGVLALSRTGELTAFNHRGIMPLPEEISSNVVSVTSGHGGVDLVVITGDGVIHEYFSGNAEGGLDSWVHCSARISSRGPVLFEKGVGGKTVCFADGSWEAFDNQIRFAVKPAFTEVTSQGPFKSLKIVNSQIGRFMVGIR